MIRGHINRQPIPTTLTDVTSRDFGRCFLQDRLAKHNRSNTIVQLFNDLPQVSLLLIGISFQLTFALYRKMNATIRKTTTANARAHRTITSLRLLGRRLIRSRGSSMGDFSSKNYSLLVI